MSRPLWITLFLSLVLSLWAAFQSEDEGVVEVPERASRGSVKSHRIQTQQVISSTRPLTGQTDAKGNAQAALSQPVNAAASALTHAVEKWQVRIAAPVNVPKPMALRAWGSQQPPSPPPYQPPPPPPPMAPPFPHSWVGRFIDDKPLAVLTSQHNTWVVKVGDVLDGQWRVDTINERQLDLTYLPLQQAQAVRMK